MGLTTSMQILRHALVRSDNVIRPSMLTRIKVAWRGSAEHKKPTLRVSRYRPHYRFRSRRTLLQGVQIPSSLLARPLMQSVGLVWGLRPISIPQSSIRRASVEARYLPWSLRLQPKFPSAGQR
jgi:hypothetical protein